MTLPNIQGLQPSQFLNLHWKEVSVFHHALREKKKLLSIIYVTFLQEPISIFGPVLQNYCYSFWYWVSGRSWNCRYRVIKPMQTRQPRPIKPVSLFLSNLSGFCYFKAFYHIQSSSWVYFPLMPPLFHFIRFSSWVLF